MAETDARETGDGAGGTGERVAVVSGATRGIGRAIAHGLGADGWHVVALGRTVGALEELDDGIRAAGGPAPTLVPLDLEDVAAIDRLGAALHARHGRVDCLVSAAATLGKLSPVGHVTEKLWNRAMAVNATAPFRLVRTLDPLMRAAPRAAVVFLTCKEATARPAFYGHFAASKSAMEALAGVYAAENARHPIAVTLRDPGPAATKLRRDAFPGEDQAHLPNADEAARPILDEIRTAFPAAV